jgi:hypothetical protein
VESAAGDLPCRHALRVLPSPELPERVHDGPMLPGIVEFLLETIEDDDDRGWAGEPLTNV